MLGRILAICLGLITLATACYSPPQPDCGFACGLGGVCPSGYFCVSSDGLPNGTCHRNGTSETERCAAAPPTDAPRPIDAPRPADADLQPPSVFQTVPAQNETNVPVTTQVRVAFTEPVLNVNTGTFLVFANSIGVSGTVMQLDPYNYAFTPTAALPAGGNIAVTFTNGIYDTSGNPLVMYTYNFTTAP